MSVGDAGFMFNFGAKEAAIESPSPPSLKEESSSNVENHPFQFFSEVASLLKLTCSTTNNNEGSSNIWELNYPNHDFIEIPLLNISSDNSSGPSITGQTPHHMPSVVGGHYTSTPLSITSLYHRKAPRVDGLERVDMRATTDCQAVSDQGDHQGVTLDHSPIRSDRMDIIHGRYLGGLKVWSCAPDVARYVSPYGKGRDCLLQQLYGTRGNTPNSRVVVELGCGHALPIIAAMQTFISSSDAALKSSSSPLIVPEVTFYAHDYNWEVIEECVMPNILRNIPRHILGEIMRTTSVGTRGNTMVGIDSSVKATGGFGIFMGSGEWDRLILPSEYADVVLGADVTYDLAATTKFLTALSRILRPPPSVVYSNSNSVQGSCDTPCLPIAGGIAIVGTKEYYFGTNGGLQQMYEVIGQLSLPLRIEEIERYGACSMTRVLVVIKRV
eukprot:Tbor_TRINITY_DN2709_c0_g1::TRINITY_DN2709_c0_g1_i1::g.15281::m.15281